MRAFRHVYEEQLKSLLSESHIVLQQGRSADARKPGGFILNKLSTSTADIRSSFAGSMSSLSPARGSGFMSQSIADFGVSPSLSSSSQESFRGPL